MITRKEVGFVPLMRAHIINHRIVVRGLLPGISKQEILHPFKVHLYSAIKGKQIPLHLEPHNCDCSASLQPG